MNKPTFRRHADGSTSLVTMDGLQNIVANLGTARDKASHTIYGHHTIDDQQLLAMYRTSSIAKRIINLPAQDSLREWREWQAEGADITAIEKEEKRLGLTGLLIKAMKRARLYGGAALFIGTGEKNIEEELRPDQIKKGGIKYLSLVNRRDLTAMELGRDPNLPTYGKPTMYQMATVEGSIDIHPSRLVVLIGEEIPDDVYASIDHGWGDSVLNAALTEVRNLDATMGNIASLVFEAKVDVMGVDGFNEGLRTGGEEYERIVAKRAQLIAQGKGINGMMLKDALDTYEQKSANFSTLPDIAKTFMQMTSAAAGMSVPWLFRMTPGGLNSNGDSDMRNDYDTIKAIQTLEIEPAIAILDECLIRSALGSRPADLHFNWRPLWQPTAKERAENGKAAAETFKIIGESTDLPKEAIDEALVNTLTEMGAAPGLEVAVAEHFGGTSRPEPTPAERGEPETEDPDT